MYSYNKATHTMPKKFNNVYCCDVLFLFLCVMGHFYCAFMYNITTELVMMQPKYTF